MDQLLDLELSNPHAIFGSPDDLKLRSCLTLFAAVAPDEPRFRDALHRFYPDGPDAPTLGLLQQPAPMAPHRAGLPDAG